MSHGREPPTWIFAWDRTSDTSTWDLPGDLTLITIDPFRYLRKSGTAGLREHVGKLNNPTFGWNRKVRCGGCKTPGRTRLAPCQPGRQGGEGGGARGQPGGLE